MNAVLSIAFVLISFSTIGQNICDKYFGYNWQSEKILFDSCGKILSDQITFKPYDHNLCCYDILNLNCVDSTYEFRFMDTISSHGSNCEMELSRFTGIGSNMEGVWKMRNGNMCFQSNECSSLTCYTVSFSSSQIVLDEKRKTNSNK